MRDLHSLILRTLPIALLVLSATSAQAAAVSAGSGAGDDTFLITTSVSPNVVMLLDNSKSMMQIEWHPKFDQFADSYGCDEFDNDKVYATAELDPTETHCERERIIFDPIKDETLWDGRYLNWYFSPEADEYVDEIENAISEQAGCTQAGGAAQFEDKYRRTRFQAAQFVLLNLLCLAEPKGIRFGLAEYRMPADAESEDPNGAFVSVALDVANPSHAANLEAATKLTIPGSETPLGESLFQLFQYYQSRDPLQTCLGKNGIDRFPPYAYDKFGDLNVTPLGDPIQFECQKSFVVIVTDGSSSYDDFDRDPADTSIGFDQFDSLIGDYNVDGEIEEPGNDEESAYYLDDIALFANEKDMRPDLDGQQNIDTYLVGLATEPEDDTRLRKAADMGNGLFFRVRDGEELALALIAALNDIVEKAQSFTSAAVPSARTVDGGDFYQSYFFPSGRSAFWEGHLRAWHITAGGSITDKFSNCALDDPTAGECNSGPFLASAVYFWDAAEQIPAPAQRNLLTTVLSGSNPILVDFDDSLDAADLQLQPFTVASDPAPNSALYVALAGSTAINEEGLADEIIQFVRGCYFATGVTTSDVSVPAACAPRSALLGDIFHSSPIVARQPLAVNYDPSYLAFKTTYAQRKRMIYTGTNAGFLHGFHAGTWQSAATPPRYDEGTGAEYMGFMPWQSRQSIKNLPVDPPTARTHYVDGSPMIADVWIDQNSMSKTKMTDGREWHTVLVGGLRHGGEQYYALDITNPKDPTDASDNGIAGPDGNRDYPELLWEFPKEGDPAGDIPLLGESWSTPILARVKVGNHAAGTWDERWVAIVSGGYHATGDPNDAGNFVSTAEKGHGLYIIDVPTGKVLAEKRLNASDRATDAQASLAYAVAATPAVFDLNSDGFADVIYVGDLGGNVFRWNISEIGEDRPNDGSGLRTQPNWPLTLFFQKPPETSGSDTYYKSFYFSPAGTLEGTTLWLAFGTGQRNDLGDEGDSGTLADNNRFYVVKDPDPYGIAYPMPSTVTEADLTDATGLSSVTVTNRGFYFLVDDGEKFVTNTEIFAHLVIAGTFRPTNTGDACTTRGEARAYAFDLRSGEGYYKDSLGNIVRSTDIGAGLPSDPKTSVGPDGTTNRAFIQRGTETESFELENIKLEASGLYWREIH